MGDDRGYIIPQMEYNSKVGITISLPLGNGALPVYPLTSPPTMTPLFETMDNFASQGGAITDYEFICDSMNKKPSTLFELLDQTDPEQAFVDEEYRDEREDSSRLADRHSC